MNKENSQPILTVLIGTCNRIDLLKICIESIVNKVSRGCRIIIIDAGSTDGTIEYVQQLDQVELVQDGEPLGQAQSLNRLLPSITSRYVCWLSDDNEVRPFALDLGVEILEAHSCIGMVSLKVRDVSGGREHKAYIGGLRESGIITCNQGILRTDLMVSVGGFDETFKDYGIDVDLTAKVLLSNKKVVLTRAVSVLHHRDHHGLPGAICGDRSEKIRRSYELFSQKYPYLEKYGYFATLRREFWGWMWKMLAYITKYFIQEPYVSNERLLNCYNILNGRYVSKLDWWNCRNEIFYIAQSMPTRVVEQHQGK